jgi:tRNA(Arg) A34 adenosine deaminase TadA
MPNPGDALMDEADERFLRRALELAAGAREAGNMPFGSLLVGPNGEVLAEEPNTVLTEADITAHPELKLARWAGRELAADIARKTTMYTSCQPCSMCKEGIARSGLGRVVFALSADQLHQMGAPPGTEEVRYEGPALFDDARVPVAGYYP